MWEQRATLEIKVTQPDEMMQHVHPVQFRLAGGITIQVETSMASVDIGHDKTILEHWDFGRLRFMWRTIYLEKILRKLNDQRDQDEIEKSAYKMSQKIQARLGMKPKVDIDRALRDAVDTKIADQVRVGAYTRRDDAKNRVWYHVGNDVCFSFGHDKWSEVKLLYIHHPEFGTIFIDGDRVRKAFKLRQKEAATAALKGQAIPILPSHNPRLLRLAELCQEAVSLHPEICDANGTPIRPLVERHLPELAKRHIMAMQSASSEERLIIDAELERGIEGVGKSVEEALAMNSDKKRQDLGEQIRFLQMRHPEQI